MTRAYNLTIIYYLTVPYLSHVDLSFCTDENKYKRGSADDSNSGISADAASTSRAAWAVFDCVSSLGVCYVAEVGARSSYI